MQRVNLESSSSSAESHRHEFNPLNSDNISPRYGARGPDSPTKAHQPPSQNKPVKTHRAIGRAPYLQGATPCLLYRRAFTD